LGFRGEFVNRTLRGSLNRMTAKTNNAEYTEKFRSVKRRKNRGIKLLIIQKVFLWGVRWYVALEKEEGGTLTGRKCAEKAEGE